MLALLEQAHEALLDRFSQSIEVVTDALVTPTSITEHPVTIGGCVYRADGTKVALSERFGGYRGDYFPTSNPETVEPVGDVTDIAGRGLYLGHYMGGHFGHFIIETLSTFWILRQTPIDAFDYVLFHPFAFGTGMPRYVIDCFAQFGLKPDQVRFASGATLRCEHLTVPERLMRLNHSADRHLRGVYDHLVAACGPSMPLAGPIYLSRRLLSRHQHHRVVANEILIEHAFRTRGFEIIYPEQLPLLSQIGLYRRSSAVAGLSGSALHNAVFMRPGAVLIELGDPRYDGQPAPTQALCNAIGAVDPCFIPFMGRIFGPRRTMLFNIEALERELDQKGWEVRNYGRRKRRSLAWSTSLPEIAYLSLRPSVGAAVRAARNYGNRVLTARR